jgi:hypothetical protein
MIVPSLRAYRHGVVSGQKPGKIGQGAGAAGGCSMIRNTIRIFG